jgi:hypothetical protein
MLRPMSWQEIAAVLYLSLGGAMTVVGVRIVASHLATRGQQADRTRTRAPRLGTGLIMMALGGGMLLAANRVLDLLVAMR